MSIQDRERWDRRHAVASALTPRASVLALPVASRPDALALDLACGQGRHAAVLADKGYRVVAMDVSIVALRHARARVESATERFCAVQADAEAWPFAPSCLDLVVQVDFLERALLASIVESLAPGGLLLIDTFLDQGRPNEEGPSNAAFLLQPGELPRALPALRVVRYHETRGATARATLLARKDGP